MDHKRTSCASQKAPERRRKKHKLLLLQQSLHPHIDYQPENLLHKNYPSPVQRRLYRPPPVPETAPLAQSSSAPPIVQPSPLQHEDQKKALNKQCAPPTRKEAPSTPAATRPSRLAGRNSAGPRWQPSPSARTRTLRARTDSAPRRARGVGLGRTRTGSGRRH